MRAFFSFDTAENGASNIWAISYASATLQWSGKQLCVRLGAREGVQRGPDEEDDPRLDALLQVDVKRAEVRREPLGGRPGGPRLHGHLPDSILEIRLEEERGIFLQPTNQHVVSNTFVSKSMYVLPTYIFVQI